MDYLAVGNDELGDEIGDSIKCPHCGKQHLVEYGQKQLADGTWMESRTLSFYKCGDESYLCAINGRAIPRLVGGE